MGTYRFSGGGGGGEGGFGGFVSLLELSRYFHSLWFLFKGHAQLVVYSNI